jgi:hypothetical protein
MLNNYAQKMALLAVVMVGSLSGTAVAGAGNQGGLVGYGCKA